MSHPPEAPAEAEKFLGLAGEAIWHAQTNGRRGQCGQPILLGYAAAVWITTAAFVRRYEGPVLARRFGAQYEAYRRGVPA